MKKNNWIIIALITIVAVFAVGCSKKEPVAQTPETPAPKVVATEKGAYTDGVYFAMEDTFASSGWKSTVTLTVKDNKIVDVDWNGVNINGGVDKKTYDKAGKYNMKAFGAAQSEWYEQAEKVEAYLVQTQDPKNIAYSDNEGSTDAIAGVSIHVSEMFELAQKALAKGPVGVGPYVDGAYFAIDDEYPSSGWKEYISLTVLNGRIVAVNWSGVNSAGDEKKAYDKAGKYNMVKFGGAQAEWYQQAEKAEAYLVKIQDPSNVVYTDDEGHVDTIGGVSIHVDAMFDLANKALKAGPVTLGDYQDGGYYASEAALGSTGWKSFVSLLVKDGNIVNVYWSAVDADGNDKKAFDREGNYNMVEFGGAIDEWFVQADRVEKHLLATQDPKKITYSDDEGHTDDITGATIHVDDFYTLVEQALANGPKKY